MRIALLEDDLEQAQLIIQWLEGAGHRCIHHANSDGFLRTVLRESFDLLILDWLVPGMSGIDVLKRFRESGRDYTPVIVVTALDKESDVVEALQAGADDYMSKPVRRFELLARLSALARRARGGLTEDDLPEVEPYTIDNERKHIALHGQPVTLTHREFDLAVFMFKNAGRVVSRAHVLETIWGLNNPDMNTRTVDTHMSRLRKKLNFREENGWQLTAIYQHGYRLERLSEVEEATSQED